MGKRKIWAGLIWAIDQDDEEDSMLSVVAGAQLCQISDPDTVIHLPDSLDEISNQTIDDRYLLSGLVPMPAHR